MAQRLKIMAMLAMLLICLMTIEYGTAENTEYSGTLPGGLSWVVSDGELSITGAGCIPDYTLESNAPWYSLRDEITELSIGEGVTAIGDYAFMECSEVQDIYVPSSVQRIGNGAFYRTWPSTISLPFVGESASPTEYDRTTFGYIFGKVNASTAGATQQWNYYYQIPATLYDVEIRDSTNIPNWAFNNCEYLEVFRGNSGIKRIENNAFNGCTYLQEFYLPEGLEYIGSSAFSGCSSPTQLQIPGTVTTIGANTFRGCTGLTSVVIPDTVTSIGQCPFYGVSLTSLTIPFIGYNASNPYVLGMIFSNGSISSEAGYTKQGDAYYPIPETLKYVKVTNSQTIGAYTFQNCSGIRTIILNDGITSLGDYAFQQCSGLSSLSVPSGVVSVGKYCFSGCSNISSLTIPDGVTVLPRGLFDGCAKLATLKLPKNVQELSAGLFKNCSALTSVQLPRALTAIPDELFSGCTNLGNVTIPNTVKSIGYAAFRDCQSITAVTITSRVTNIGSMAFAGTGITSLMVPNGVTSLGAGMVAGTQLVSLSVPFIGTSANATETDGLLGVFFECRTVTSYYNTAPEGAWVYQYGVPTSTSGTWYYYGIPETLKTLNITNAGRIPDYALHNCSMLTNVTISRSPESVGKYAFAGCSGLTELYLGDSVTSMGIKALAGCSGLTSFELSEALTVLENYLFKDCTGLTEIRMPTGVTAIGKGVFSGCTGMTALNLPKGLTVIPEETCNGCTALKTVQIPEGITGIETGAFACAGLQQVSFPDTLQTIGDGAFRGCTDLEEIVIPDSVQTIGDGAFRECGIVSITMPFTGQSRTSEGWKATAGYIFGTEETKNDETVEGAILQYAYHTESQTVQGQVSWTNFYYFIPQTLRTVTITDMTRVPDSAFYGMNMLKSVVLNNGITYIGEMAFANCRNIETLMIPSGVTSIGRSSFSFCESLPEIILPEGLMSVGERAMQYCRSINSIRIPAGITDIPEGLFQHCDNLAEVEMHSEMKTIGSNAFAECQSLDRIDLPDGLQEIGGGAFARCSAMTEMIVPESVQSIGQGAFYGTPLVSISVPFVGASRTATMMEGPFGYIFDYKKVYYEIINDDIYTFTGNLPDETLQYVLGNYGYWYYVPATLRSISITDATRLPDYALTNMDKVTSISLNPEIMSIGDYAFYGCTCLGDLELPGKVKCIGEYTFYNCECITQIEMEELDEIGKSAFSGCKNLQSFIAHGGNITETGHGSFSHCTSLSEVQLPDSLETIGTMTFTYCKALKEFTLPESLTTIRNNAFSNSGIQHIEFNNNLKTIESAFGSCTDLELDRLPDGLVTIGEAAFDRCVKITRMTVPASVTAIGEGAFGGTNMEEISIPFVGNSRTSTNWYGPLGYIFGYEETKGDYTVSGAICQFRLYSESGYIQGQINWTNFYYFIPETLRTVHITDATRIPENAFAELSQLTTITLNEGITSMGQSAFSNCRNLTALSIPSTVTRMGDGCLSNCRSIQEITIPAAVTEAGDRFLWYCIGLHRLIIENGLAEIPESGFANNQEMTSVEIPVSVTSIGTGAFSATGIIDVWYAGTEEQWAQIQKAGGNDPLLSARIHYRAGEYKTLILPENITSVESEAFAGLSGTYRIIMTESVAFIDSSAFSGTDVIIMAPAESYAERWADENGKEFVATE